MEAMYEETEVKIITQDVESCYTLMEVSSPKRRKKSKGQGDKADTEKKPRSAFLLYYFDVHQSLQQEFPDLPQSEINKRISESWRMLNVVDKGYYLAKAKLEKEGVDPEKQPIGTSTDIPGFRKILPRRDYVILPKGALVGDGTCSQDACAASVEVQVEGSEPLQSVAQATSQEAVLSPMELGSEVELSEQCIAIEGLTDETAVALSRSGILQEILSQCSSASGLDRQASGLLLQEKMAEAVGAGSTVGVVMEDRGSASQTALDGSRDAAHLVAIIPNHKVAATRVAPTAGSVLLVPAAPTVDPEPPQSFKLSIKYTRRGRGNCASPGCSFSYVTRHKPPFCPNCGQHLGGKWIPVVKRGQSKPPVSPIKPEGASRARSRASAPPADDPKFKAEGKCVSCAVANADQEATGRPGAARGLAMPGTEIEDGAVGLPAGGDVKPSAAQLQAMANPSPLPAATLTTPPKPAGGRSRKRERGGVKLGPKRPVRAILPAPIRAVQPCRLPAQIQTSVVARTSLVQWVALSADKFQYEAPKNSIKAVKSRMGKVTGLKPSTLTQLGHAVAVDQPRQELPVPVNSGQVVVTDKGLKVLSVVSLKHNPGMNLDLGLSTARGRGKCKNPECSYVYKNRHKPSECPFCGCQLSKKRNDKPNMLVEAGVPVLGAAGLLDPYWPLSPAQRETQRQSTLQLLRRCAQIPESEAELWDAMALIRVLDGAEVELSSSEPGRGGGKDSPPEQPGWPAFYESAALHCALCKFPLFKGGQSSVAGQEDCWLLTESHLQTATIQLKICLNPQCLALHSFTDIHPGLFNVGNKLLVSLDLLFRIRNEIRLGNNPTEAALSILRGVRNQPVHTLSPEELCHIQELLCSGYWAFECLTARDYNEMICGVCGMAPKVEIARRNAGNVLHLQHVEFTWPDFQAPDEVNTDDFWLTMESEAIEQAAFPASIPITKFDASIIAPFFPPLMRNSVVINTEKDKNVSDDPPQGDPAVLVRLIHDGALRPDRVLEHEAEELREILEHCGAPCNRHSTKDEMAAAVSMLYAHVQNGLAIRPRPPNDVTAGKLYKVCPHQVVCGSKYMVRRESVRDHVDLLVSSRYWPPVYVTDSPHQVALCTDVLYPELASLMWGKNQGCFSDPMGDPEYVSCAELQDRPTVDLSGGEGILVHPVTKSASRWIVHPGEGDEGDLITSARRHYALSLCRELEPYRDVVSERGDRDEGGDLRAKPMAFDNPAYYFLYNRLVDFLSSKDIVARQIANVLQGCRPGEVVIRDALYRLGVAQINTEAEPEEEGEEPGLSEVEIVMS